MITICEIHSASALIHGFRNPRERGFQCLLEVSVTQTEFTESDINAEVANELVLYIVAASVAPLIVYAEVMQHVQLLVLCTYNQLLAGYFR